MIFLVDQGSLKCSTLKGSAAAASVCCATVAAFLSRRLGRKGRDRDGRCRGEETRWTSRRLLRRLRCLTPAAVCGRQRSSGQFLTSLYFFMKCLYLTNAVGQLYLMERFVGSKVNFYGARVLADLVNGRDWQRSGHFPRVTFCDMEAKKLGKNYV